MKKIVSENLLEFRTSGEIIKLSPDILIKKQREEFINKYFDLEHDIVEVEANSDGEVILTSYMLDISNSKIDIIPFDIIISEIIYADNVQFKYKGARLPQMTAHSYITFENSNIETINKYIEAEQIIFKNTNLTLEKIHKLEDTNLIKAEKIIL